MDEEVTTVSVGTFQTTDAMRRHINDVLDSGRLSYGPKSQEFERQFSAIHGCAYGVLSNSGTSALQIAIQALKEMHGWRDGDEIIVPALTFVATVNAVLHNRLAPVLVDVEPDYYGIDLKQIKDACTDRTRAVLPVHLFGQPCNLRMLLLVANDNNLRIIEDACESAFAKMSYPISLTRDNWDEVIDGRAVGSWGDVGCFSFYVAHHLVCGVGGMSTTNDPDLAQIMRSLVNHGIDVDELPHGDEYDPSWLSRKFRFSRIGHSFRVTELEAALGLAGLETWEADLWKRQRNAAYLTERLSDMSEHLQLPAVRLAATHSWMLYPIVLRDRTKWGMMNHLRDCGIESREMVPLTEQPAYRGLWDPADYPVALAINRAGFYVGCHQGLTESELDRIVEGIRGYWG